METYLKRVSPEQLKADISRILDAACYTNAETGSEVCELLQSVINQVQQHIEQAKENTCEFYCIPSSHAQTYQMFQTLAQKNPGFRLVDNRTEEEKERTNLAHAIKRVLLQQKIESSLFENDLREQMQLLYPNAHEQIRD